MLKENARSDASQPVRRQPVDAARPGPAGETASRTLAGEMFERLRVDILSARLPPGTKLRFD